MIKSDQPTCFNDKVVVAVSSKEDGQMQHGWNEADEAVNANRAAFLAANDLNMERSVLVRVRYSDNPTFDRIKDVSIDDAGIGMYRAEGENFDCLVTQDKGLALFLPVADCGATVVYDPKNQVLAVAHLGRHSTIAHLAHKLITHLESTYQTNPKDVIIWNSPGIQKESYHLDHVDFARGNKRWNDYIDQLPNGKYAVDIHGYNTSLFVDAGVSPQHIHSATVDTAKSANYWSHFTETAVHHRPAPPRFAVVAALSE